MAENQEQQEPQEDTEEELVDIRTVSVSPDLPREERIAEFVRQIKNPYRFRCGKFIINASFTNDGVTLEDRLRSLIRL
jgi:hypothetical protein